MELIARVNKLRNRLCQYRLERTGVKDVSTPGSAVEIVLSLTELGIKDKRPIRKDEENGFRAGLYLSYVFENSEWENISIEFNEVVHAVESENYFGK